MTHTGPWLPPPQPADAPHVLTAGVAPTSTPSSAGCTRRYQVFLPGKSFFTSPGLVAPFCASLVPNVPCVPPSYLMISFPVNVLVSLFPYTLEFLRQERHFGHLCLPTLRSHCRKQVPANLPHHDSHVSVEVSERAPAGCRDLAQVGR